MSKSYRKAGVVMKNKPRKTRATPEQMKERYYFLCKLLKEYGTGLQAKFYINSLAKKFDLSSTAALKFFYKNVNKSCRDTGESLVTDGSEIQIKEPPQDVRRVPLAEPSTPGVLITLEEATAAVILLRRVPSPRAKELGHRIEDAITVAVGL
jgi:hypothetical protein